MPEVGALISNRDPAASGGGALVVNPEAMDASEVSSCENARVIDGTTANDEQASGRPRLTLEEQPKARGFRFRYGCEGPSHGGITGENSERGRRTFPTVKLHNYSGKIARVVVSLICHDDPWRPHAHSLVGRNVVCGQAVVEITADTNWEHAFANLGILHVTKKNVANVLLERYAIALVQDSPCAMTAPEPSAGEELPGGKNAMFCIDEATREKLRVLANEQAAQMNLSAARLCFQAFLQDQHGQFTKGLVPVVSQVIYDSKSPSSSALKICRMHRNSGSAAGGDEIYILCDRVQREDIQVKFISESSEHPWEADGIFSPADVHRQCAIVVKTPPYRDQAIKNPVNVVIRLKRQTGEEMSEGKIFTYTPVVFDEEMIGRKRKKAYARFDASESSRGGVQPPSKEAAFSSRSAAPPAAPVASAIPQFTANMPAAVTSLVSVPPVPLPSQGSTMVSSGWLAHPKGWGFTNVSNPSLPDPGLLNSGNQQTMFGGTPTASQPAQDSGNSMSLFPPLNGSFPNNGMPVNNTAGSRDAALALNQVTGQGAIQQATAQMDANLQSPGQQSNASALSAISPQLIAGSPMGSSSLPVVGGKPASLPAQSPLTGPGNILTPQSVPLSGFSPGSMQNGNSSYSATPAQILHNLKTFLATSNMSILQDGEHSMLHLAVLAKTIDVTSALLKLLPHLPPGLVNSTDSESNTMLHLAVSSMQNQLVSELIRCNADITLRDRQGNNSVHLACQLGNAPLLRILLSGKDVANTSNGGQSILQQLDQHNYDGKSPVHLAIKAHSLDCVQLLNAEGFAMDSQGGLCGSTSLHAVVEDNQLAICAYLLRNHCVNINVKNYQGNAALHLAAEKGLVEMTRGLVQSGANKALKNSQNKVPAELATSEAVIAALQGN